MVLYADFNRYTLERLKVTVVLYGNVKSIKPWSFYFNALYSETNTRIEIRFESHEPIQPSMDVGIVMLVGTPYNAKTFATIKSGCSELIEYGLESTCMEIKSQSHPSKWSEIGSLI